MKLKAIGKNLVTGVVVTARLTTGAVSVAKDLAVNNKRKLSNFTEGVVLAAGAATKATGEGVAVAAAAAAGLSHRAGEKNNGALGKGLGHALGYVADGAALIGSGTAKLGSVVMAGASTVGEATAGAAAGSVSFVSDSLDAVTITDNEIQNLRRELIRHGEGLRHTSEELTVLLQGEHDSTPSRELLDRLVVGGITLSAAIASPSEVPVQVEAAYRLAYPVLASSESFGEAAARMTTEELAGLVSGVKGKLFELEFVAYLNAGALPEGHVATLARSATQEGWDIQIVDGSGHVVEVLQAKATESVRYVQEAIERYPDIDVVATSEVYAELAALTAADGVRDSGITEAALDGIVWGAATGADGAVDIADLLPSGVGLAVVGLSVFMDKSISPEERVQMFAERGVRVGVSSMAGYALMDTELWWLAIFVGLGTHWIPGKGRQKRAQLKELTAILKTLKNMHKEGANSASSG